MCLFCGDSGFGVVQVFGGGRAAAPIWIDTGKAILVEVMHGGAGPTTRAHNEFLLRLKRLARYLRWLACSLLPDALVAHEGFDSDAACIQFRTQWKFFEPSQRHFVQLGL
jgi:hypothetical protein